MTGPMAAPEGGLVVDKPAGLTSHDVVAVARRGLGVKRIGHAGTLDPAATGVLVLLIGRATRLARYLASHEKEYEAVVRFGWATDTYDAAGRPQRAAAAVPPDRAAVESALAKFRGRFLQRPPPISAKKIGGRRAYALARRDVPVELAPVAVDVSDLELTAVEGGTARLRITCSAGFYVRSLAHDLGSALGIGAHLAELRRVRSGPFGRSGAGSLRARTAKPGLTRSVLLPPAQLLPGLPSVVVSLEGRRRVAHGQPVEAGALLGSGAVPDRGPVRLMDASGRLLGVADRRGAALHPVVVLV